MLARLQKAQKKDSGFTLIELLVVIVIIGILAGIAIPLFLNQRQKAADSAAKADARNAATAVETYYVEENSYTGAAAGADFQASENVELGILVAADGLSYCIEANNPNGDVQTYKFDSAEGAVVEVTDPATDGCGGTLTPIG